MKDMENRLHDATLRRPRRDLSSDFTAQIVAEIKAHPTRERQKENVFMRLIHAPAFMVTAGVLVLLTGGTTYAATNGFTKPFDFGNIIGYQQNKDAKGQQIVRVRTTDCTAATTATSQDADRDMTFRIKGGSGAVTTEDVLKFTQGYCEHYKASNANFNLFPRLSQFDSRNTASNTVRNEGLLGLGNGSSISLRFLDRTGGQNADFYGLVDSKKVLIEDWNGAALTKANLVSGRYADVLSRVVDGQDNVVTYIRQGSANETFYMNNRAAYQASVERVQACSSDATGYCAVTNASATAPATTETTTTTTPSTTNEAPAQQEQPAATATPTATPASSATAYVKTAYQSYFKDPSSAGKTRFIDTYATKALGTKLRREAPYDTIMCVQQMAPSAKLAFTKARSLDGGRYQVTVSMTTPENPSGRILADVVYDSAVNKLVSIDCATY